MTFGTFFSSPPIRSGAIAGGIGLIFGGCISFALAFNISSHCSAAVNDFLDTLSENITISELTATISLKGHSTAITLTDITAVLPNSVTHMMSHLHDLPSYCFSIPLLLGICFTLALSLALASCVTSGVSILNQQKENEDNRNYTFMALESGC